jgi:ribosomal silencing factor RsfS
MNGTLTQVKPASTSSFLENKVSVSTAGSNSDERVPPNAYGFDTERLSALVLDKGGEIEHLFLEGCTWIASSGFNLIGRHCISLRLLNVADCLEVGDEQIVGIATKCRSLGYLNISGCTKVSGVGLAAVFELCRDLYALCMGRLPLIDDSAEMAFAQVHRASKLRILDVSYSSNITDGCIAAIAQHCRSIEMIDISGCVLLTDFSVMALGASCPRVWALKMKLCPRVTNHGFANLTVSMRQLRILDIACNDAVEPSGFLAILKTIPMLQRLTIAGCPKLGDTAIASITQYTRRLRYLNIASCQGVSMSSLMELVHELTALRHVVVSESSISNAEVVMLSALRESCKIIRNQFRPRPVAKLAGCKMPAPKVKGGAAAPGGKKGGKK